MSENTRHIEVLIRQAARNMGRSARRILSARTMREVTAIAGYYGKHACILSSLVTFRRLKLMKMRSG
jgi:hypothetical protein